MRAILVLAAGVITCTDAWSGDIHKIIAQIATDSSLLSEGALEYILEHFPDTHTRSAADALVPIADWADSVRSSDDFHFTYTPFRACRPFDPAQDCGHGPSKGRCLVTGIQLYFDRASNMSLTAFERREAIKFLVHLVADATQPLHTGFREDAGGNAIILAYPAEMPLHDLWDHGLMDGYRASQKRASWEAIADMLTLKAVDRRATIELGSTSFVDRSFAVRMVSDTVMNATCKSAYSFAGPVSWIETGYAADRAYTMSRSAVVLSQLIKAGVWLAQVLNEVAKIYSARTGAVRAIAKESARAAFVPTTPLPTSGAIPTHNYFSVIELHFDPEAHLYTTEAEEARPAAGAGAGAGALRPKPTPPSVDDEALMAAAAAENAKHVHFGIQMDALVLVKSNGLYIITSRIIADREVGALYALEVVLNVGAAPVPFYFARTVFPSEILLKQEFVTTVFTYLSGALSAVGVESLVRSTSGQIIASPMVSPFAGFLAGIDREREREDAALAARIGASVPPFDIKSARTQSDAAFARQAGKMVILYTEKIQLLSTAELLRNDPGIQRLRVNRFMLAQGSILFIDVRLHDGGLTNSISKTISRVATMPANTRLSKEVASANPKILAALFQIGQELSDDRGPPVGGTPVVRSVVEVQQPGPRAWRLLDIILEEAPTCSLQYILNHKRL